MMTELLKEAQGLAALNGGLAIASVNGSTNTGTLDMKLFNRGQFIIGIGSAGTGNAYLKQTNNSNGASSTNMSPWNSAGTALTANSFATLEARSDQMTARYLMCQIVTDLASNLVAVGMGCEPRYAPANSQDNSAIAARAVCNI